MLKKHKLSNIIFYIVIMLLVISVPLACKRKNRAPSKPTTPSGNTTTYTNVPETYTTDASDPDGDAIRFIWNMNNQIDTTDDNYITYSWQNTGTYSIKVKAIDEKNAESDWSDALSVTVQYNKAPTLDSIWSYDQTVITGSTVTFYAVASDSTDSVRVRFMSRPKNATTYTLRNWLPYQASGSTFQDMIQFSTADTYVVRAIAQDTKGSLSDTSPSLYIYVITPGVVRPWIDTIIGPTVQPLYTFANLYNTFKTVAYDTVYDSVYVRFMYKKSTATSYTVKTWIGPKYTGSIFIDSIKFPSSTTVDTYYVRAIAKNKTGAQSDTTPIYKAIVYSGWVYTTPDNDEFYSSPALAQVGGEWILYLGGVDGYFYAVKAADGSEKWRKRSIYDPTSYPYEPDDEFYASPAVNLSLSDPHVYCGGVHGELYAYRTAAGIDWHWRFPDSSYDGVTDNEVSTSPAVSGNRIYVGMNTTYDPNEWRLFALQDNGSTWQVLNSYRTGIEIV
ncbi:MAG: PKD domain-containing protein, partial [candidate division WOR-3 bacterium]